MPVPLTFDGVSKNIIRETISSAIFIDDHALENFKSRNSNFKDDHKRTIGLFNDFKKNQCLLHSFKFTKSGWKKDKKFYLKNKDLLILDWQLVKEDHTEALKILDQAVLEKSLHFICIYTKESEEAVKNELNRFFLGDVSEEKRQEIKDLLSGSDLDDYWTLEKTNEDWQKADEMINSIINAHKVDQPQQIADFQTHYNLDATKIITISEIAQCNISHSYAKLKTILSKDQEEFSKPLNNSSFIQSTNDSFTFYIGHTIVKIIQKDQVSGEQLYDEFLTSLLKEKNIFLTLMGLEMRNRFRENSAFIGKDFDDLSEDAFFYHKNKNSQNPYIFIDFLRDILKDQVASFLYENNFKLFDVLDEYYGMVNGNAKLAAFEAGANVVNFRNEVFKLNYFYNRININHRKSNDFLRFGDVFKTQFDIEDPITHAVTQIDKYFLCITPHCDCLRPSEKIKNQFWFIEGKKEGSQESVLKKTDGKFVSFVNDENNEIIAINWVNGKDFCQPFTMHVPNNKFTNSLTANYYGTNINLLLIISIKENYTQRIANEAFGYPLRVGIDFVKKS